MEVLDLIAGLRDSPLTAAIGCASIAPTIVWTIAMVHWMVMGEIEPVYGFPSILVGIGLCYIALDPADPIYSMFALSGIVGMLIVFPIARRQLVRREMIQIDIEQIEKAYEMLAQKPGNEVTRFKLAESVYARGMIGQAIEIGSEAISGMPMDLFPNENKTIEKWKRQARDPNLFRPVPCLECGFYNKPANIYCERCRSDYLAIYARGRWLGSELVQKLVASWIVAMVSLVGLPVTLSLDDVPVTVILVLLQVALVVFLVWRTFLSKKKEQLQA